MNERVILRRMRNGRQAETLEYPVADTHEILIGREDDCTLRLKEPEDDLVSRRHARIQMSGGDPVEASITDLGSSNGTFVNRQRVLNSTRLKPGDVLQFGAGGPEFQFDTEPKPAASKATRMADVPAAALPTREAPLPTMPARLPNAPPPPPSSGSTTVGKATVERMITQSKAQHRNQLLIGGFAVLVLLGALAGYLLTRPKPAPQVIVQQTPAAAGITASDVASKNTDAVVFIETAWSLIDAQNGRTLNQLYLPNATKDAKSGKVVPIVAGGPTMLPAFVVTNNALEPVLTTDDGGGANAPISIIASGSGFVVSNDGFILTNRHVASGWDSSYGGWDLHGDRYGVVIDGDGNERGVDARSFPNWIPSQAKLIFEGKPSAENLRRVSDELGFAHQVQGRNDVLNVTFAKQSLRAQAKLSRVSDHADVAMIKVDLPKSLTKVELNDNYSTIKAGDGVVVMGYPGVTPDVVRVVGSVDIGNRASSAATVPDPTVTSGNVGRILRNGDSKSPDERTVSTYGDYYQLQINTIAHGNSGGPVFDSNGKVIGIFTRGRENAGSSVTYALPIRYGLELMGESPK